MDEKVKSGKEILDDFFENIDKIENVDPEIAKMLNKLYKDDKLSDTNVKNELQTLRETDVDKD
ncbi:hypothetical protein [Salegentibacter salegens]|uniref:Uncharacterized protein n=1 Tax=Salegentibacter salegens TaxID=143223 RepID=A0A1M7IP05_9FLAO|nr:hypothetical protein [Salegentibacter salegens]PRX39672.1 hypothetical protein LY58_03295 [Salegentibacter salegens]SHM42460.1 hypothetical protein SAMN05878281_0634 [Salegentibacter salegens]